jgi:hypothetical protein
MRAIGPLDVRLAADAELQPAAISGSGHVRGLAGREPASGGPGAQRPHRGRLLTQAGLDRPLQALDPTLPPTVQVRRGKPAQPPQHVDGADVALLGQGGLGGLRDPLSEAGVSHHPRRTGLEPTSPAVGRWQGQHRRGRRRRTQPSALRAGVRGGGERGVWCRPK